MMATKYQTISEFIELDSQTPISYNNLSFKEKIENIEFTIHNVIFDYITEIKSYAYKVTMSDKEFIRYKYRPKLLANDIYGNSEFYFIILAINNLADIKDFNNKTILLLKKEDLIDIISKIYNAEKSNIDTFNNKNMASAQ